MKRLGVLLMSAAILASLCGCMANVQPEYSLDKYDLEGYTQPYWTGNNVNHLNDFLARTYAQGTFRTVAGEKN